MTRQGWLGYLLLVLVLCAVPGDADIRLGGGGGGGGGGVVVSEVDGTPSGTFTTLKFSNGAVADNGDGSATITTGVGGGGDASTNTATSVDGEVVLFSGAGGKTLKRATTSGLLFGTAGVLSAAIPGTHYVLPSGNVATATALAANGANCAAGLAPLGVDAAGAVEGCFAVALQSALDAHVALTNPHSATALNTPDRLVLRDSLGNFSAGTITATLNGTATTATTATGLAADGANCTAGQAPLGVDALGAVQGCFDVATQVELDAHAALTNPHFATAANTVNRLVLRDASGNFAAGVITATLAGNASTATALATNGTNCPAGQASAGSDASGNAEGCFTASSGIIATELDGTPTGTFTTLKFPNGAVTDNGDGSATIATGAGGGGDFSSNTATSVDGEVVLFAGTAGKTGRRATLTASVVKSTAGVLSAATPGTDYVVPGGNVATATALAADGLNCTAGQAPLGVDAAGAAQGCFDVATQVELDTHANLTNPHSAVSTNTPNRLVLRDISGNFAANVITGTLSGNASTATALAANGTNCTGGQVPTGVDAAGNAEGCFLPVGGALSDPGANGYVVRTTSTTTVARTITGTTNQVAVANGDGVSGNTVLSIPNNPTLPGTTTGTFSGTLAGTASTATALAANGSNCSAGQVPLGVDASGNVEGCYTPTIADNAITYAKIQDISGVSRLLGRGATGGAGDPQEITLGPTLVMTGTQLDATTGGDVTSVGDCLSGACDVVGNLRHKPMVATYSGATVTITLGNTQLADLGTMTAPFTVANPTGTAYDREFLRLHVCSDAPRAITWGSEFRARYGPPLPTFTTGTANCDLFGFQRDQAASKWDMVSTTQASLAAARHTCAIVLGDDDPASSVIPDAKLTTQRGLCMVTSSARVEEITVEADAGTPNVVVHRRTSAGVTTPLLGSALATNASGTVNCARSSTEAAQPGYAGITCATTLTEANRIIGAGDWIGLTSGSGSSARRFSIMVSYVYLN